MKSCGIIICLITLIFFNSCSKTRVQGVVYSKNGFPVINGTVILNETFDANTKGIDKVVATTDNNGYFHFEFRGKWHRQYWVRCKSDSGLALGVRTRNKALLILDTY